MSQTGDCKPAGLAKAFMNNKGNVEVGIGKVFMLDARLRKKSEDNWENALETRTKNINLFKRIFKIIKRVRSNAPFLMKKNL